jgi:DNA-binding CsgD family transcriptional regulator
MRVAPPIELSAEQRTTLEAWANGRKSQVRVAERARVVLLAAEGKQNLEIAAILSISVQKAARWRWRFLAKGLPGLEPGLEPGFEKDAPRPGRLPLIGPDKVADVIRLTTLEQPAHATHWSTRSMAKHMGSSDTSVLRIWQAHGLKPHRSETFKVSNDPLFAEKLEAVVGLYLSPPEHAIVLCVDEKSQVQALDRTQPGLPLKRGRAPDHDSRLQTLRHHDAIRGHGRGDGPGNQPLPAAASAPGMVEVSG